MLDDNIIEMINLYYDDELDKKEEPAFFELLSKNNLAREYFSNLYKLSQAAVTIQEAFPPMLDEKILLSIKNKKNRLSFLTKFASHGFSYTAAAVIIILSIVIFSEISSNKKELGALRKKVENQSQTIEQLYNGMPAAVVQANFKNEIIVKAKL